jgi:hypothetical protein
MWRSSDFGNIPVPEIATGGSIVSQWFKAPQRTNRLLWCIWIFALAAFWLWGAVAVIG